MIDQLSLYDFPNDFAGRKTYVIVKGHDNLVPKYKTYYGVDLKYHILPDFGGNDMVEKGQSSFLMPDKLEYVSPIDGSRITSRSTHRDHMKRHDVVEAGDIKMGSIQRDFNSSGIAKDIQQSIEQLRSR